MAKKKGGKGRRPSSPSQPRKATTTAKARPAPRAAGAEPAAPATKSTKAAAPAAAPPKMTRAERIEAAQRARHRKSFITRAAIIAGVVALLGGVVALILSNRAATERTIDRLEAGGCRFDRRSEPDAGQGRNHISSPVYRLNPPSGGNHEAAAASPGIYTPENLPPDGRVVHAMEHGDIVLWYRPGIDENVLNQLRGLTTKHTGDTLLVPRASLPQPVVATAWHKRLLCPQPDLGALESFIDSYRDQGPEKLPED